MRLSGWRKVFSKQARPVGNGQCDSAATAGRVGPGSSAPLARDTHFDAGSLSWR